MPAEPLSLELDSLRSDQISQINGLVDRFEADLLAGLEPSPDSFVAELEDPHARLVLVRLLTQTEMEKGLSDVGRRWRALLLTRKEASLMLRRHPGLRIGR